MHRESRPVVTFKVADRAGNEYDLSMASIFEIRTACGGRQKIGVEVWQTLTLSDGRSVSRLHDGTYRCGAMLLVEVAGSE